MAIIFMLDILNDVATRIKPLWDQKYKRNKWGAIVQRL